MAKEIADFLQLPRGVVPVTTITMGYPAEIPPLTERLPLEAIVHKEIYNDFSDADIENLYAELEQLPQSKSYIKENNQKNLAQVFTNCRYKKEDNEAFSKSYYDYLKEQGFIM